jgi:hypothetical protein
MLRALVGVMGALVVVIPLSEFPAFSTCVNFYHQFESTYENR